MKRVPTIAVVLLTLGISLHLWAKPGDLDKSFGPNGTGVGYDLSSEFLSGNQFLKNYSHPYDAITLLDGSIVVGGQIYDNPSPEMGDRKFVLARFTPQGVLDSKFGTGGVTQLDFGLGVDFGLGHDVLRAIAAQSDGKIIAVGVINQFSEWDMEEMWGDPLPPDIEAKLSALPTFGMARFHADGTLDTSFGDNGKVSVGFDSKSGQLTQVAVQPDGKILVGGQIWGSGKYSIVVLRYNPDGSLDTTFGTDQSGIVSISMGMYYCASSGSSDKVNVPANLDTLTLRPDGKIVLSGSYFEPNSYNNYLQKYGQYIMMAVRLLDNGVPDPDFGFGGKITFNPDFGVLGTSHITQPDGKIVVAMTEWKDDKVKVDGYDTKLVLVRLHPNGSQDTSYGQKGVVATTLQNADYADMVVQPNGKVVFRGIYDLLRFHSDGSLDSAFGSEGKVELWDESSDNWIEANNGVVFDGLFLQSQATALQPNGDILAVAGHVSIKFPPETFPEVTTCLGFGGYYPNLKNKGIFCAWSQEDELKKKPLFFAQKTGVGILRYSGSDCAQAQWYPDKDKDGFGDSKANGAGCTESGQPPTGMVMNNLDCNDADATIHPGALEGCNDGKDNNCNGNEDEQKTWHQDTDGDGYGDASLQGTKGCTQPPKTVSNNKDCNDADKQIDATLTYYTDADGDGYGIDDGKSFKGCQVAPVGFSPWPYDCNDADKKIQPDATEQCNGVDDDCNGQIDDGADGQSCNTGQSGSCSVGSVICQNGNGSCAVVYAPQPEKCDDADNDCDNLVDDEDPDTEDTLKTDYYLDQDKDGYGDSKTLKKLCKQPKESEGNYVLQGGDCDDTNQAIHPGAQEEKCDNLDDNCNGEIDEGLTIPYSVDADKDQYIAIVSPSLDLCPGVEALPEYVPEWMIKGGGKHDCNDQDPAIHPDAPDFDCDGIDNNCYNGPDDQYVAPLCDTGKPGICAGGQLYCVTGTKICQQIHEPETEVCNGQDDDCDGETDESDAVGIPEFYPDKDQDTFGDQKSPPLLSCTDPSTPLLKYVQDDHTDCDDNDSTVNTDGVEICNDEDDNCNGSVDEGVPTSTFYVDADGDGYGSAAQTIDKCSQPTGYVASHDDCNDEEKKIHPDAVEFCNGIDDNCNSEIDEGKLDGHACDSGEPGSCGPGTDVCEKGVLKCISNTDPFGEICDGIDNDCDGKVDDADESVTGQTTFYLDNDKDGFGDINQPKKSCSQPVQYVVGDFFDCDDNNPEMSPDAAETCNNGVDDNCNGAVDGFKPDGTKDPSDGC